MPDEICARYLIETPLSVDAAAAAIAGEQSTGTFMKLASESDALTRRAGARVASITPLEEVDAPSLPGARAAPSGRYARAEIEIVWPYANIGPDLAALMATISGNLSELSELSGIKLLDVDLPPAFIDASPGPRHGVAGSRERFGLDRAPAIGTIVKPSIGLTPEETADAVAEFAAGGIDFIKDDELCVDPLNAPRSARIEAVMDVLHRHADRTGKKVMYAFNISGDFDQMRRGAEQVLAAGGDCAMLSLNWVGTPAVLALRREFPLFIHGHRNGWGLFSRAPMLGIDFRVYQKIFRLAGVDHLHVNGLRNKFTEPDASVIASARACLTPLSADDPLVMPVFSSSQTVLQAHDTFAAIQSTDLIYACGGGIVGHPGGIAEGCRALRAAWEAAVAGVPLVDAAREDRALQMAIETFAPHLASRDRASTAR
ncbi:RuBisCO large subunit C-terminal-like domain-containing protein [Pikeienuella sp. HZG-20]|uniref:RuBisCO large subunit C-terminal-like domain-containing protein n=1 Tax=Paludibacillus litoralis TaxID=3133267 RepID=UPI0030EC2D0F